MNQPVFRNGKGQIIGVLDDEWFNTDDIHYIDYKEEDVIFPRHNQYECSEVTTWNLNDK